MIINSRTNRTVLARPTICVGFFSRLIGLQFRRRIAEVEGLLLILRRRSRWGTAIHTIGMRFELGLVWLDEHFRVVDMRRAKPWRLAHVPSAPAKYCLEADPTILDRVRIGDILTLHEVEL